MRIHFISDDAWFLLGIKAGNFEKLGFPVTYLHISETPRWINMNQGDILVLSVSDIEIRKNMMRLPQLKGCRLLLMFGLPLRNTAPRVYPWVLRKDMPISTLFFFINKSLGVACNMDSASVKTREVFLSLGGGTELNELSARMNLSESHLYQVRRNVIRRYGLDTCNAMGILICRDILATAVERD